MQYLQVFCFGATFLFLIQLFLVYTGNGIISPEAATYPAILAKAQAVSNPLIYVVTNKQFSKVETLIEATIIHLSRSL